MFDIPIRVPAQTFHQFNHWIQQSNFLWNEYQHIVRTNPKLTSDQIENVLKQYSQNDQCDGIIHQIVLHNDRQVIPLQSSHYLAYNPNIKIAKKDERYFLRFPHLDFFSDIVAIEISRIGFIRTFNGTITKHRCTRASKKLKILQSNAEYHDLVDMFLKNVHTHVATQLCIYYHHIVIANCYNVRKAEMWRYDQFLEILEDVAKQFHRQIHFFDVELVFPYCHGAYAKFIATL